VDEQKMNGHQMTDMTDKNHFSPFMEVVPKNQKIKLNSQKTQKMVFYLSYLSSDARPKLDNQHLTL